MTSNQYKYFSQKKFHGGIETRQEFIEDNQLLDARNHWAPLGEMEQRPGSVAKRVSSIEVASVSEVVATTRTDGTTGVSTNMPIGYDLGNLAFGDTVTFRYSADISKLSYIRLFTDTVTNAVTKTRAVIEAWTSRGWIGVQGGSISVDQTYPATGAAESNKAYPWAGTFGTGSQYFAVAMPEDVESTTLSFSSGTQTGYFFRFIIRSATTITGSPFTAGSLYGNGGAAASTYLYFSTGLMASPVNSNQIVKSVGSFLFKYATGNYTTSLVVLPQRTGGTPAYTNEAALRVQIGSDLGIFSYLVTRYDSRYAMPLFPPSATVIPEFNTAFIAYCNLIIEVPYGTAPTQTDVYPTGSTTGPLVAQINTDPLIVGPITVENPGVPYSTDLYPQLTAFPSANLIVYFRNQLFCSGIKGIGNLIRWSGSSTDGAYNVWPEDNQVTLSTARDNSDITAVAPLGDNLVVFKKNSIWQMIDNGISDVNLPLYEPRLVVAGVGTVAHQSVQAVQGGLIFLAEDGFYFYDGTPNIKRISDPIQPYTDRINPARSPFAVATVWRSKQAYMCAVSLDSETQANDFVFVYAYDTGAWWVWDGLDVQCWYQQDGVGLKEELYALDKTGKAYQLGVWTQTDNGAEIDSWFLTPRFGFDDAITKTALELRVRGINNNPTVNYNVIGDDVEINVAGSATVDPLTLPITMAGVDEAQYTDDEVYGEAVYAPTRRRERKSANRTTASWFQIRIRKMLKVFGFDLGYEPEGRR